MTVDADDEGTLREQLHGQITIDRDLTD